MTKERDWIGLDEKLQDGKGKKLDWMEKEGKKSNLKRGGDILDGNMWPP